jgi:hypothetical protein
MIKVIPDMLKCEGWFSVEVNGEVLKDKFGGYRRFRSEKAAFKAGKKFLDNLN